MSQPNPDLRGSPTEGVVAMSAGPTDGPRVPGPLDGMVVAEMAAVLAGPYAGHLLRLLGAEVVKVESPAGDPFRGWGADSSETGQMFDWVNAGKGSLVVDFKASPELPPALRDLLRKTDVLVVSGRPGTLERRGLTLELCHDLNPNMVVAILTGFGPGGPLSALPAYDSVVQASTGLLSAYGVRPEHIPTSLPSVADMAGGLVLTQAVLAGLVSALRGRGGRLVETSLYEATAALMAPTYLRADAEGARLEQSLIFQLSCADENDIIVHLSTNEAFWSRLALLVAPALLKDARFATYRDRVNNYSMLHSDLAGAFRASSAAEWERRLAEIDIPASRVMTPFAARIQPQSVASGVVQPDGEAIGVAPSGGPWRLDGERPVLREVAPRLGEYSNDSVGYD